MVKKLKKKKKNLQDPLDEVVLETSFEDDGSSSPLLNDNVDFA